MGHALQSFRPIAMLAVLALFGGPGSVSAQSVRDEAADTDIESSLQLVMYEEDGCGWCKAWTEDIGPIYPKTEEGKRAPLRRVDIHRERPVDLQEIQGTRFTPTFVLVAEGREVGRINGYPGEDFFWGLLGNLIEKYDDRHKTDG